MAGREVKGWVVPHQLGVALIVLVLGAVGTMWWRMNDQIEQERQTAATAMQEQRDLLIRLDEKLAAKNEKDKEEQERWEKRFQNIEAWQTVTNRELVKLQQRGGQ